MFNTTLRRFTCCLILGSLSLPSIAETSANAVAVDIGALPYEKCVDASLQDDLAEGNQRFWYSRSARSVGGEGTCFLGFPSAKEAWGEIMINGVMIQVHPVRSSKRKAMIFKSKDGQITVTINTTGGGTTCEPDADKCCGDYTYATLTVRQKGLSRSIKVTNYVGG